jgi:PAS domain S-box-containing protein
MRLMAGQQRRRALEVTVESLVALVALAVLTWVSHRLQIRSGPAAVLTFCLVVLVSLRGRLAPALAVAAGGAVAWGYLFTGPEVTAAERQLRGVATLIAFCATAFVITRLVRALRTSEGRWKSVFENNPTTYFVVDTSGIIVSANAFGAEQLGYAVAELVGRPMLDVVVEEHRAAVHGHLARCHAHPGQSLTWEVQRVRKDGTTFWARVTARAVELEPGRPVVLVAGEDITERKRAEEELRRTQAYLAEAQRLTRTGSWAVKVAPREIVHWSEQQFHIHGLDPKGGPPHWETVIRSAHPDDRPRVEAAFEHAVRDKVDFELEYRTAEADGASKHIRSAAHPTFGASGEVVGFVGASIDVTAEKEAEEERRAHLWFLESMDRINRAMQGANDIEQMMSDVLGAALSIFDCDQMGLVYPCDPDARAWHGVMSRARPEFPLQYRPVLEDMPGREETLRVFRAARAAGGPVRLGATTDPPITARMVNDLGVRSALVMALYPKVDAPYLFGMSQCSHARIWTDQEERLFQEIGRRLADALTTLLVLRDLRESARRYQNIFQTAQVSIWEEDFSRVKAAIDELRAGGVEDFRRYFAEHPELVAQAVRMVRIVDVNDATVALFGAQDKEDLLRSLEKVFTPDTLSIFTEHLLAIAEGRSSLAAEATLRTVNGDRLDVLLTTAFPPEHATLDNALVSIMDITARKRAEEGLQRAQADLVRAGALTTMGELAASITHELGQPLAAIALNGSAAMRWLDRADPDLAEAREAASRTVKEAERAAEVIRGLRDLLGNRALRRAPFDINGAVDEVLALVRGKLWQSDIAVRTDLARELPPVFGDRVQLEQVLLNLVLNGMDAIGSAHGGARELVLRTESAGPQGVGVAVDDSGVGLDPATAEHIFDRFFTTKENGLGMGLSICRSIVDAHGGRLSASARSPRGSTFRFTVPTDAPAADRDAVVPTVRGDALHGGSAAGGLSRA